ncbi:hypothetical protein [Ferrovibrio terrae]|uniref:hypothetical protein n=1 Tax=Ferrovibrio terrae TaxID=2594003 RepID=UPI003138152F
MTTRMLYRRRPAAPALPPKKPPTMTDLAVIGARRLAKRARDNERTAIQLGDAAEAADYNEVAADLEKKADALEAGTLTFDYETHKHLVTEGRKP